MLLMTLQARLVQGMAEVGELTLAEDYRKQFKLPKELVAADAASMDAAAAARAQKFLALPLSQGTVHFVDDDAGVARSALRPRDCVPVNLSGVCLEWVLRMTASGWLQLCVCCL